jgi:hypothetical protein
LIFLKLVRKMVAIILEAKFANSATTDFMMKISLPMHVLLFASLAVTCVVQAQPNEPSFPAVTKANPARTKVTPGPANQKNSATSPANGPWRVIEKVSEKELGGARNTHKYRSQSNAKGTHANGETAIDKASPKITDKKSVLPKKKKEG